MDGRLPIWSHLGTLFFHFSHERVRIFGTVCVGCARARIFTNPTSYVRKMSVLYARKRLSAARARVPFVQVRTCALSGMGG